MGERDMNQFEVDLQHSESQRNKLRDFYSIKAHEGRYIFINKDKLISKWLQDNAVDTIMQISNRDEVYIEEKIVRWKGKKYEAMTLEVMSCTVPGREKDGWMKYAKADILAYGFEQEDGSVELYIMNLFKLKDWFWKNVKNYATTTTEQINRTVCKVVPIKDIQENVGFKKFLIPWNK